MKNGEHRVVRRGSDGVNYQWSNAEERPSGSGWEQVDKSQHPRATSYKWIRPASYIKSDQKRLRKAVVDAPSLPQAIGRFFSPRHYFAKMFDYREKIAAGEHKVGDRVTFGGSTYYVSKPANENNEIKIKNAITGEEKQVNYDEVTVAPPDGNEYPEGATVKLARGVVDNRKEVSAEIAGKEKSGKYRVTIDKGKSFFSVYPEAINSVVPQKEETDHVDQRLLDRPDLFSDPGQQRIVRILNAAVKQKRTTVTVDEVRKQLAAEGHPMSEFYVMHAFRDMGLIQPNIQYNSANGTLTIENGYKTIEHVAKIRNIHVDDSEIGMINLTSDSKTEMYGYLGQQVKTKDGERGIIQKISGRKVQVKTSSGVVESFINNLMDEVTNKNIIANPASPETFGKLRHRDAFWTLRDREHCQGMRQGEIVTLLPGTSKLSGERVGKGQVRGRVVSPNADGTVTVDLEQGEVKQRAVLSPRQLSLSRKFNDFGQFAEYATMRPTSLLYNHSFYVGDTRIDIGGPGKRGSEQTKRIDVVFQNGNDLIKNEHIFCQGITANALTGRKGYLPMIAVHEEGTGGWFQGLFGQDKVQTVGPSKQLTKIMQRLFPNVRTLHVARDTSTYSPADMASVNKEVKLSFTFDTNTHGPEVRWEQVLEQLSPHADNPRAIRASEIPDAHSIKISADDHNLYLTLGSAMKAFESTLPALTVKRQEEGLRKNKSHVVSAIPLPGEQTTATFDGVVNSTGFVKKIRWADEPNLDELVRCASVFTYDKQHDRYAVDRSNYDEMKKFLERFFGRSTASYHIYETEDGGYFFRSPENLLRDPKIIADRDNLDAIKNNINDVPGLTPDNGFFANLRKYQNPAVHFAISRDSSLLALDQGTGKTISSLGAAVWRLNKMEEDDLHAGVTRKHRVLILAPASVAKTAWVNDANYSLRDKETGKGKYDYQVLMGKDRTEGFKKLADEDDNTTFAITSFDTFRQDYQELKNMNFDMVILDESQSIKNDMDEESAAMTARLVKNMLEEVRYKIALTGTPMENKPEDLHSILEFLNPELFGSQEKFLNDFIETDFMEVFDARGKKTKRPVAISLKNTKALKTKLDQIMFRINKELDLMNSKVPEIRGSIISGTDHYARMKALYEHPNTPSKEKEKIEKMPVIPEKYHNLANVRFDKKSGTLDYSEADEAPLTYEGYDEYRSMVDLAKTRLREKALADIRMGKPVDYQSMLTRLQQVMNDPSLLAKPMGPEFDVSVPNPKVDRMINLIEHNFPSKNLKDDQEPGKVIIFARHLETIRFLEKSIINHFPGLKGRILRFTGQADKGYEKDKRKLEELFNKDATYPIMLANDAAKTGVNLPAASMVINYDADWNPQDINQRIDRAHRVRDFGRIYHGKELAPPRKVKAYTLAVIDPSGNISSTVESKKLANRIYKENMFKYLVDRREEYAAELLSDDFQGIAEELLNVANPKGIDRVDAGEYRRYTAEKARERQRSDVQRSVGSYLARYFA